jgi:hypothetical protein
VRTGRVPASRLKPLCFQARSCRSFLFADELLGAQDGEKAVAEEFGEGLDGFDREFVEGALTVVKPGGGEDVEVGVENKVVAKGLDGGNGGELAIGEIEAGGRRVAPSTPIGVTSFRPGLPSRIVTISEFVKEIKRNSSLWAKGNESLRDFSWRSGYGCFSVSESQVLVVSRYIENQEEHHRKITFQDEYRELLRRHGETWDERYVWD